MNIQRMMVIMAHPDDIEIHCYGIIKKLIDKGTVCQLIIATNGENGISEFISEKQSIRKKETENSLSDLSSEIIWLGMKDGGVLLDSNLIECMKNLITKYNPELIITHFPDNLGMEHQDHSIVGKAVINAAFRYANNLKYLLLSQPLFSNMTNFKPNCFVEISDVYDLKIKAIQNHKSQSGKFYMSDYFHQMRSAAITPYINLQNVDKNAKYELFQIIYERIL